MKKFSLLLVCAAAFALTQPAGAQVFNHLAVGLGAGTDGASLELASPLGSHIDVRVGYGAAFGLLGYTIKDVSLPEHPGNSTGPKANVPLTIKLGMSDARLLFNIYPSATGGFHFTLGAYMGSARFARGIAENIPSDYNTVGINVDGYLVKAENGVLETGLCAAGLGSPSFAVKPYAGIGFGRAVAADKRVGFSFDLGAQYQGDPGIWGDGESITGRVKRVQITEQEFEDLAGVVDDYGKYLKFWPTLNFHLYVNLF